MSKKIAYRGTKYSISDESVKILWPGDSKSRSYLPEHFRSYLKPFPLAQNTIGGKTLIVTKSQLESYIDEILLISKTSKQMDKEWKDNLKNHTPQFSVGDYLVYTLSYATVLYQITKIAGKPNSQTYKLKGERLLLDDGSNPHKTEAKYYEPYCFFLDTNAKCRKVIGPELESLLEEGTAIFQPSKDNENEQ